MEVSRGIRILGLAMVVGVCIEATPAVAQFTLEGHAGVGYSSVDIDAWAGSSLNDWDLTSRVAYLQFFFVKVGTVSVGAEVGNQRFFWYNVRLPFGTTTILSDRYASANRVMGVARFQGVGSLFFEVGVGAHLFDNFTDGAFSAALGYKVPLGPKMFIPLKVRADLVNDASTRIVPISVSGGLSVGF